MSSGTIAVPLPAAGTAVYRPARNLLHKVMRENLETYLACGAHGEQRAAPGSVLAMGDLDAETGPMAPEGIIAEGGIAQRFHPEVVSGLLGVFLRAVETTVRQNSPDAPAGRRFQS